MSSPEEENKEEVLQQEEEQKILDPEYVYPEDYVPRVLPDSSISNQYLAHLYFKSFHYLIFQPNLRF